MPAHRFTRITRLFTRGSAAETQRLTEVLRRETVGGMLLVVAAALAMIAANSPLAEGYEWLRRFEFGPESLHLRLSLEAWASDGLLAIFFFLVGLELKREFVAGDLRDPKKALVPVVAAAGGVVVPAALFALLNLGQATIRGWAIPTATDIAFAVAVLAVIGSHLPTALRTFLLTLAVVDDLIAICIIAVFYSDAVAWTPLAAALAVVAVYAVVVHVGAGFFARHAKSSWLLLVPLGFLAWAFLHASGLHATLAGVALGLMVPVVRPGTPETPGLAEILEHRLRPFSAGFAVPVFAFLAAGVHVGGLEGLGAALTNPVAVGIMVGLVVGKPIGIVGSTWVLTRLTRAELDESVAWIDLVGVGLLGGIGFTVSLLIAGLSFGPTPTGDAARVAVLTASVLAAAAASGVLVGRNRRYRSY